MKKYKDRQHRLIPKKDARAWKSFLHGVLDAVFETDTAQTLSDKDFAELAGVAPRTVALHRNREIECPFFITVWKMARAAGITLKSGTDRSIGHEGRKHRAKDIVLEYAEA